MVVLTVDGHNILEMCGQSHVRSRFNRFFSDIHEQKSLITQCKTFRYYKKFFTDTYITSAETAILFYLPLIRFVKWRDDYIDYHFEST